MARTNPQTGETVGISLESLHGKREEQKLPKLDPGMPWLYKHHPERWDVLGDKVRPVLGRFKSVGGVNNVGRDNDPRPGVLHAQKRGWVLLDASKVGESYLKRHKVPGGHAYLSRFETCFAGSTRIRTDDAAYYAFLDRLLADHIIEPPQLEVLEDLLEKYTERALRYRKNGSPAAINKAAENERRMAIIEKAIEALQATTEPAEGEDAAGDAPSAKGGKKS